MDHLTKKPLFNPQGDTSLNARRMIGGNTTNLNDFNNMRYAWVKDWYRQAMNNFWIPEEISLGQDKKDYHVFLVFINAVNIAVGEIWEFYEYAMLIFFNNDCINHYSQGVHDTITDVLCATVAGILLTLLIMRYHKTGKGNFFTNVYEKFYERNIAGK